LVAVTGHADFEEVGAAAGIDDDAPADGGLLWADVDGDGDLDALVNNNMVTRYFRNDGGDPPTFTDVTTMVALGLSQPAPGGSARSIGAADLTNDGIVDIIRFGSDRLEVYLGQSDGTFGDSAQAANFFMDDTTPQSYTTNMEGGGVLDLNDDGYLDIVVQNDSGVRFLMNPGDGSAAFDYATPQPAGVATTNTSGADPDAGLTANGDYLTVTDFDVDGLVDFAARINLGPDIHRQSSVGAFTPLDPDITGDNSNKGSIIFCDFDSDGDFDYIFTDGYSSDPDVNHVFLFEAGSFNRNSEVIPAGADGLDCGDVDNDGDADLLWSGFGEKRVLLNQWIENGGTGIELVPMSLGSASSGNGEGGVLGDYDRDGDLDAMIVQKAEPNLLLRNDTNDDNYVVVRMRADVGSCATGGPVLREDTGGFAVLATQDGTSLGAREVNGGQGHGSQGTGWLHWGLPDGPTSTYELTVHFHHGDHPPARLRVVPSELGAQNADGYQLLEVVSTDPDGDSIPTIDEMNDAAGVDDLDGDGYPNWFDPDSDGDGFSDAAEAGDADPCTPAIDGDGNGVADYLEETTEPPDASVPDASVDASVDGSTLDAGGGDAGPGELQLHGSGCVRCVATGRGAGLPAIGFLAAVGLLLAHRRRRR
jgi:hypothetical protein